MVNDSIAMIRRRIDRIELQWSGAGVNDVVLGAGGYEHRETGTDRRPNAVEHRFARPLLDPEELIECVDLLPDLLLGLERHEHELTVLGRVEHAPELAVLHGELFDVFDKAFHWNSPVLGVDEWVPRHAPHRCQVKRNLI